MGMNQVFDRHNSGESLQRSEAHDIKDLSFTEARVVHTVMDELHGL